VAFASFDRDSSRRHSAERGSVHCISPDRLLKWATRIERCGQLLIIVCLLAIAPLVIAALVQIAVHELRCAYDYGRARFVADETLQGNPLGSAPVENWPCITRQTLFYPLTPAMD
jgi:hypothetical protein